MAPSVPAKRAGATPGAGWLFCDDFESDRLSKYFEYDQASGAFVRTVGTGVGGSVGMRATYTMGSTGAGSLKVAFGRIALARPTSARSTRHRRTTAKCTGALRGSPLPVHPCAIIAWLQIFAKIRASCLFGHRLHPNSLPRSTVHFAVDAGTNYRNVPAGFFARREAGYGGTVRAS